MTSQEKGLLGATNSRPTWLVHASLALAMLLGTFALGRASAALSPEPQSPTTDQMVRLQSLIERLERQSSISSSKAPRDGDRDVRRELEELLRERGEIGHTAAAAAAPAPSDQEPVSAAPDQPLQDEALASYDRGQSLVRNALSSRVWTNEQANEMRRILARLPGERRRELLEPLLSAMSRGEVTSNGPPI